MNSQNQFETSPGAGRDMLNYTPGATPSADAWLAAFTQDFLAHPDGSHGAQALMSGLRFYTADFAAELAALPPVEVRLPPLTGSVARAIYTATGLLILGVYEQWIRRHASHAEIQAAFTAALPGLQAQYHGTSMSDDGIGY
jgi:hypothetical protein